jgi:ElaB/YqjD/DUF883 family membrane-anchored ribosome-binding protein
MNKSASSDHATTDRLSESAHESVDHIAESAGKAEERIRHGASEAKTRVMDAGEKVKERSDDTLHAIFNFVGENPLTAIGLAFAAGALVTALKRRA